MKAHFKLLIAGLFLSGCTRSCSKPSSSATSALDPTRVETWKLKLGTLETSLPLNKSDETTLTLSGESMTLNQGNQSLKLKVTGWENADFANLSFDGNIGYFRWNVMPGDKRFDDRPYLCSKEEEKPSGLTRVEETYQMKTIMIYLEDEKTKAVTLKLDAMVPEQSFWVQTGAIPLKMCAKK